MNHPFEFTARIRSFKYAFCGCKYFLVSQHNARIHSLATVLVVILGIFFHISSSDWCWIAITITLVWMAELFNTAIELLADAAISDFHPLVEKAKDMAAGAVLIAAAGAVIIGWLVFHPYFKIFYNSIGSN